jgi:predicted nucleic acid-binding protein
LHEKGRPADDGALSDQLSNQAPDDAIVWIMRDAPHLYPTVLGLIRSSWDTLNFNDALVALACRARGGPAIASFDADFDQVAWLRRLARPEDVTPQT